MKLLKIDVTKIDKALLYKGTKGTYLDAALHENRDGTDQYGNDGFITQSVSKEERAKGTKGPIIGNWRNLEKRGDSARKAPETPKDVDEDPVPF